MATRLANVFSADAVTFTLAGLTVTSGRGPDEFVRVEQSEDDFSYAAGIDGEGTFSQNKNTFTLVTLTLMQTSQGNDVLSALHNASKKAGGLPAPIFIEDRKGNYKLVSSSALIMKTPDQTFAKEAGTTVWVIGVHDPEVFSGGH